MGQKNRNQRGIYNLYTMLEPWDVDTDLLDLKELENQIAQLVDKSNVEEMLKIQLAEFEMLQSMFSNPGELCVDDYSVLADFNNYLDGRTSLIPPHLDFTINLSLVPNKLEVCVNLPLEYPNLEPDIFVRCENLNRSQQRILNSDLAKYISNLERGEICICTAIAWLQENGLQYFDRTAIDIPHDVIPQLLDGEKMFNRFWIYSHHIYSKSKRREVLDLAHEYNVTGFCLPGRPGIMCIEGLASDCEEWWHKVRCMNWKKIMCKKKEEIPLDNADINEAKKFSDFKEISFEGSKGKRRDYHMDFGEFYKYLTEHNCEYIFKDYFGIDGK